MQIRAVSIGEAIPAERFDAVIQSVFDSAVNLRLERENRLITVLISDRYRLPQGIQIVHRDAPLRSLEPGQRAACRGGWLRFDASPLSIDLRAVPVWKCQVADLAVDMSSSLAQHAWSTAWELLNRRQAQAKSDIVANELFSLQSGSLLGQRIGRPVMLWVTAANSFDAGRSLQAAEGLIGLGPGATPSGDDILIGFLAALWSLAGRHAGRISFLQTFGEGLLRIADRTNELSRTYLYHATLGQFSSTLSALVETIGAGREVEPAMQEAFSIGHSSGMDSVTGLLVGLAVWNEPSPWLPASFQSEKQITG